MAAASDRMHGPIPPDPPETDHEFYQTRFTGNTVCSECGLLPLDDEDYYSECLSKPYEPATSCCGDYHYADCPIRTGG